MRQKIVKSPIQVSLLVLYLTPILLLVWFIAEFRVNVPSWDEWPVSTIFEKVATGEVEFGDWVEPYNQHRYLFLRLIIVPLAFFTNWNKDYELAVSVILAVLTWLVTLQISRRKFAPDAASKVPFHLANTLTAFLIFSLVQYQNWLWGLQMGVFLVNLCLALTVLILDSGYHSHPQKSLSLAAIPCVISSFTMAQGLASWLAVTPMIWILNDGNRRKFRVLLHWFGLFLLTVFAYFLGAERTEAETSKLVIFLADPLYFIRFFFTVIGAALAPFSPGVAFAVGTGVFALFLGLIFRGITLYKFEFIRQIYPWLSLAVFALLFSGLVTVGRATIGAADGDGAAFSLGSRYTTNSLFLIVALVQVYYTLIFQESRQKSLGKFPTIFIFQLALVLLLAMSSIDSINQGKLHRQRLKDEQYCLHFIQVIDDRHFCWDWWETMIFPETMRSYAQFLNTINFIDSPEIKFVQSDGEIQGKITQPKPNQEILVRNPKDVLSISGEFHLSDNFLSKNSSYLIALSYGDRQTIIAAGEFIPLTQKDSNRKLRWKVSFYAESLPIGETVLKAWLYNPKRRELVSLKGEVTVKKIPQEIDSNVSFNSNPSKIYGYVSSPATQLLATSNQRVTLLGWAGFPSQVEQPRQVFLSIGNEKYFVGDAEINIESPDVAEALGSSRYSNSRWLTTIPTWILPPGETTVKAWVYDPKLKQFVKLNDEVTVKVLPKKTNFVTPSQEIYGYIDTSKIPETSLTLFPGETLPLEGWAILPDIAEQPKQVMFSYGNEQSFFGWANINLPSPDVAQTLNSSKYNQARWNLNLPVRFLPLGKHTIKAWIYHPQKQQFIQLQNEVTVNIVTSKVV